MSNPGLHFHLAAALRRRLAMIASVAGVMSLLGYWVGMALPNYYRSSATIFVATQEINQRLAESGAAPFDLGIELRRVTSQVLSRGRLSELIDDLDLYRQPPRYQGLGESKQLPSDEAIARVRSSVQVIPVETGIAGADPQGGAAPGSFRISFAHRNPKLAAAVAQRLAEAFVEEYIDSRVQNQETVWDAEALATSASGNVALNVDLERRLQRLQLQLAEFRARGFTDRHPGLIRAEREIWELRDQIQADVADRRLEASLQVGVEASQLAEQFRIVDPALPPQKPSSPDRLWVILIGVIVGIGSGVAAAWVAEVNDSSFHAIRDVKSAFQIPVLAVIPDIVFPADRTARRRRRVRNALAASGVAAFCLTGGVATYAYVNGMPDWLREAMEAREPDGRIGPLGTRTPLRDLRWLPSPDSGRSPQAREV